MSKRTLVVATCQFPVSSDITRNRRYVMKQVRLAKSQGAHVAHLPECALSGYAGVDFKSYDGFDWRLLEDSMHQILNLARQLEIWVVLGSSHRLTGKHKPHNSLYIIESTGNIVDRYDKMLCAGNEGGTLGDLAHYSPGNHFCVFEIDGIRCGTLICHEYRYPELYREYQRRGVEVVFHSYHAGHLSPKRLKEMRRQVGAKFRPLNPGSTLPEITMPAAMHAAAADNYVWISCSNTSARESCWPSFVVRPDGVIEGRLRRNTAGVLCMSIDPTKGYYDSTAPWRARVMRGIYHSGTLVKDPRTEDRKTL